jgi:hypothetical protein
MSTQAITMPYVESAETDAGDSFVWATLACLLLLAIPIKNAAYALPFVFFALQFLSGNLGFVGRTLILTSLAVVVSIVSIVIDSFYGLTVNPGGLMLGVLTYGTLIVILALRPDFSIRPARRRQLTTVVSLFVIVESLIGMMQYLACGDPDAVCGTFGLLDFHTKVYAMGQVSLTFNLFAMILYLSTDVKGILPKVAIGIGLLACALAHSGHQTIFLIVSLGVIAIVSMKAKHFVKLAFFLSVMLVLTASVSTVYWTDMKFWYERVAENDKAPKKMATVAGAEVLSSPKNLILGVGMGQFNSRAALIASGEYLSVPLPGFLTGESEYYRDHIVPAIYEYDKNGLGSAIGKPYYSVLSMVVEFGLPLMLLMAAVVAYQFVRNLRLAHSSDSRAQTVGIVANVGLLFFVLCLFIENYVELPQAIFVPALLYIAALASVTPPEASADE